MLRSSDRCRLDHLVHQASGEPEFGDVRLWSEQHAGASFPDQGSNLPPLQWERGALTRGPPGKSQSQDISVSLSFVTESPVRLLEKQGDFYYENRYLGVSRVWEGPAPWIPRAVSLSSKGGLNFNALLLWGHLICGGRKGWC